MNSLAQGHYENTSMQYTEILLAEQKIHQKNFVIFNTFPQNIDNTEAVLMSTHNLCFGSKIRKIGILLQTPVLLYKSVVLGGIHCTDMFS